MLYLKFKVEKYEILRQGISVPGRSAAGGGGLCGCDAPGNRPAGMEMTGVLRGFLLRLERELNPASEYVSADGFSEESFVLRRRHGTALNRTGTASLSDFRESFPQTKQAGES